MARPWLFAAVAVAALGASACSGSGGGGATTAVANAVRATMNAGTVHETVSSGTPTASGSLTSTASGAYSFTAHIGEFAVDTGALAGKLTVRLNNDTLFIKIPPALAAAVPKGKAWLSASLAHPPTVPGSGNVASLAGGADPTRVVEALLNASSGAKKVGSATAAGHPATQYTVSIDLSKDKSPLASSEATLIGGPKATADVFVGQDGRLARLVLHVALAGGTSGTITTDYDSYGLKVAVATPPAAQVVDATQVLGG